MSEDYLEAGTDTGSENRRPFLMIAGALAIIFILTIICTGAVLAFRNRGNGNGNGNGEERTIRLTQNAETLALNALVTQTVAAIETEAARPTNTIVPTNTPQPTNTIVPTNTPVVSSAKETETPIANGTNVFAASGSADSTPTAIAGLSGGGSGDSALPETGIDAWMAVLAGVALIGVLFGARRLRTG